MSEKISKDNLSKVCITVLFISTPFLTSILSYKYDSLTVSIALLASVLFGIIKLRNCFATDVLRLLLAISIFCLYQPVVSMAFGVIGLMILKDKGSNNIKIVIKDTARKSATIIIGFFIYKKTISDIYLSEYYKQQGEILKINKESIESVIHNMSGYILLIKDFIANPYILIPLIICLTLCVFTLIKNAKFLLHTLLAIPFIFVATIGCNFILKSPAFQARELMGFACLFISIVIFSSSEKNGILSKYLIPTLSIGVFITNTLISYTFLNYKDEIARRDSNILSDINIAINHYGISEIKKINLLYSPLQPSKKQENMESAYPIINKMIFEKGFSSTWYAKAFLSEENEINFPMEQGYEKIILPDFKTCFTDSKLTDGTMYLSIRKNCRN